MKNILLKVHDVYKKIFTFIVSIIILTSCNSGGSQTSQSVPTLNQNNLNLIFVQTSQNNESANNLSITGFNHSLLLGQLLNQITAGNVESVFSQEPFSNLGAQGIPSMAATQTIENYAVLNTASLNVLLDNESTNVVNFINNIVASQISGNYVFTLPANLINQVLTIMSSNPTLYFNFNPITNSSQYIILSFDKLQSATAATYSDGINPSSTYPQLNLQTGAQCLQTSYTFTTPENNVPLGINSNETVYFVRHTEAHPVKKFENQNYVCQGQWRAIGANQAIYNAIGGLPDLIYSSDPAQLSTVDDITYVRPSLTINPFAIYYNMPLNLVPASQFVYTNVESMDSFFFTGGKFDNKTLLVSWEHDHIQLAVESLIENIYNQPLPTNFPVWQEDDYDTIYKLQINRNGQLTFSNTCEGIANTSLPLSCPTF